MWDERYSEPDYAYGKEPNQFLVEHFQAIPKGRVLCLAEGEGRNAVFLARQGYTVTAVDSSAVGLAKTQQLAAEHQVSVAVVQADLSAFEIAEGAWEGIVSIFCPLPPAIRVAVHRQVVTGLAPNGVFLLEAYRPEQLAYGTGGGRAAEVMQTVDSVTAELSGLTFSHLLACERSVVEGRYHTGLGAVVQAVAVKSFGA